MEEEEEDGGDDWDSDAESVAAADINLPPNPRRYFNQRLRPVYEQVPIPTRPGSELGVAASIGVPQGSYTRTLPRKGKNKWCHSVRTPSHPPPIPLYAGSFKALLGMIEEGENDSDENGDDGDDDSPPPKRGKGATGKTKAAPAKPKTSTPKAHDETQVGKPFGRKVAMNGVMRTYKVRMWPDGPQRAELTRVFRVARNAYNWCNSEVRARNVRVNKIDIRNHYVRNGRAVAQGANGGNVEAGIEKSACEQLAVAHSNAIAARTDGAITHFDVRYRSLRKTLTETIKIAKSVTSEGLHCPSPFVAFRSAYSNAETEELERDIETIEKRLRSLKVSLGARAAANAHRIDELTAELVEKQQQLSDLKSQLLAAYQALVPEKRAEGFLQLSHGFKGLGGIRLQDKGRVVCKLLSEGTKLQEDALIQWDKRIRAFYLCYRFVAPVPPDPDPTWETKSVSANDGGTRGFQHNCNATSGVYSELACGLKDKIHDRVEKLDDLHSRIVRSRQGQGVRRQDKRKKTRRTRRRDAWNAAQRRAQQGRLPLNQCPMGRECHARGRRMLSRKLRRDRVRQTNWIRAVHYDCIAQQLEHADVIINPVLRTSQMAPRAGRVIGSTTVRAMYTMCHYGYNQRMCSKAQTFVDASGRGGRHVIPDTGEPGTTRTCPNPDCGRWFADLGGNEVFHCPHCGVEVKRDDNGARGNLLAAYGKAVGILADGTSNY